jgi:hypothetical protein
MTASPLAREQITRPHNHARTHLVLVLDGSSAERSGATTANRGGRVAWA